MKINLLKNAHAAIAALFITMFAMPTKMQAQTSYELEIADTKVTSTNCDDLSAINGVSGTVKYDPVAKVLTLQDAKMGTAYIRKSKA